jgi:hypothetical protein
VPRWDDTQHGFVAALLDSAREVPRGLVGPDGEPSPDRFSVYRNNVVVGLTEALRANFPAVRHIVGDAFFRAMARAHAVSNPPASPVLLDYGATFADFIAGFEPAASMPYLADVARIDRAWTEAYHAPDAEALAPEALAAIPTERVAETCLAVHPSLRIVRSGFPAVTIWRMNVVDGVRAPVALDAGGEDALVVRPEADVDVHSLAPGGAEFVTTLAHGRTLADATMAALSAAAGFDLSGSLTQLIRAGIFTGVSDPGIALKAAPKRESS